MIPLRNRLKVGPGPGLHDALLVRPLPMVSVHITKESAEVRASEVLIVAGTMLFVLNPMACTQQVSGGSDLSSGVCARCEDGQPTGASYDEAACAAAAQTANCRSYELKNPSTTQPPTCELEGNLYPACYLYDCEIDPTGLPPWLGEGAC